MPELRKQIALLTIILASCSAAAVAVNRSSGRLCNVRNLLGIYRVAQNKIPHQTLCNFSTTSCPILKILEAA